MIHDATTLEIIQACTNTGRWGSSDELGTLNHITDAVRLAAIRAVSYGAAVSIGLDLPTRSGGSGSAVHVMGTAVGSTSVVDTLTVSPHGFEITHLDALAHNFLDERAYNGRAQSEVLSPMGLSFGSVMSARDGIVTRGVLLDVAAARGVEYVGRTEGIGVDDIEAAESLSGARAEAGDAVFLRIGTAVLEAAEGPLGNFVRPGIRPEVLPWLQRREVAVYSGDCIEQMPSGLPSIAMPLHQIGQAAMGLALLDIPNVETLRAACTRYATPTFLLVVAPLRLPGGTGTAVNPIAIF